MVHEVNTPVRIDRRRTDSSEDQQLLVLHIALFKSRLLL